MSVPTYTLTELRDLCAEYNSEARPGEIEIIDAEDFLDWLERIEAFNAILEDDLEADDDPVDLFGVGGVAGLATRREIAALDTEFLSNEPLDAEEQHELDQEA